VITAVVTVAVTSSAEVSMIRRDRAIEPGKSGCVIPKAPNSTAHAASAPLAR
jgi:hypothetical protein